MLDRHPRHRARRVSFDTVLCLNGAPDRVRHRRMRRSRAASLERTYGGELDRPRRRSERSSSNTTPLSTDVVDALTDPFELGDRPAGAGRGDDPRRRLRAARGLGRPLPARATPPSRWPTRRCPASSLASLVGVAARRSGPPPGLAVAALLRSGSPGARCASAPRRAIAVAVTSLFGLGDPARPLARGPAAARRAAVRRSAERLRRRPCGLRRAGRARRGRRARLRSPSRCCVSASTPDAPPSLGAGPGAGRLALLGLLALTTLVAVQALGNLLVVADRDRPRRRRAADRRPGRLGATRGRGRDRGRTPGSPASTSATTSTSPRAPRSRSPRLPPSSRPCPSARRGDPARPPGGTHRAWS